LFLVMQLAAYSVFKMYRDSKHAQIHLASTIGIIGLLLATIHLLGRYQTLLSDQVNLFQTSVVHGLSYTDQLINIPKAYILAGAAVILTIWIVVALFRGKIFTAIRPLTDRKSTRLNSSHVSISYAVFCLKKKTPYISTGSRQSR